jgi:hypothetical protein
MMELSKITVTPKKPRGDKLFLSPDEKEVKALLVDLKRLKAKYNTPCFVILIQECTDCLLVSAPYPIDESSPGPTVNTRKFSYTSFDLHSAAAFVQNARTLWDMNKPKLEAA